MNVFVIPAFNEELNVPRLLQDLEGRPELWEGGYVILVDDGSTDGTVAAAGAHVGELPLVVVPQIRNQGPGRAFDRGFRMALELCDDDDFVITMESDTTSDLNALTTMLDAARGGADIVLASLCDGAELVNVARHRRALSHAASFVIRRGSGLDAHTVSSFFRVYRAGALRKAYDAARRRPDPRAGLRLQGGDPDQARPDGRRDRGGSGLGRLEQPRGREQAARAPDRPRLRAGHGPPGDGEGAGMMRAPAADRGHVAIVGGGLLGLTTAYRLTQAGVSVTVYERAPVLGGLAATTNLDGIPVDRFYHVVLPTDDRVIGLGRGPRHRP